MNAGSILKRNFFISEMRTSLGFQFLPWKCTARHYRRNGKIKSNGCLFALYFDYSRKNIDGETEFE